MTIFVHFCGQRRRPWGLPNLARIVPTSPLPLRRPGVRARARHPHTPKNRRLTATRNLSNFRPTFRFFKSDPSSFFTVKNDVVVHVSDQEHVARPCGPAGAEAGLAAQGLCEYNTIEVLTRPETCITFRV